MGSTRENTERYFCDLIMVHVEKLERQIDDMWRVAFFTLQIHQYIDT